MQGRLHAAINKILATDSSGYATVSAAPESRQVKMYWKGSVPAAVRAAAAATGVPVKFLPARFTRREMVAEAKRLSYDSRVAMVSPKFDGSGLKVTVTTTEQAAGKDNILSSARLPLTMVKGARPKPLIADRESVTNRNDVTTLQSFTRLNDILPFWGGARYLTDVNVCTNGFALNVPAANIWYMLSASHCGFSGGGVLIPGQLNPTGDVIINTPIRETLIIRYPYNPFGVQGRIFTGPFTSSTSVGVGGTIENVREDRVCTGGASSGEHCNIEVGDTDIFLQNGIGPLDVAALPAGQCAAAPGDSGGPVYSYDRSDGRVNARGVISLGVQGSNAPCPGSAQTGSNVVVFTPLVALPGETPGALQFYGVNILTD
jgi:hypothetical protein